MEIKVNSILMPDGNDYVIMPPTPTEKESGGIKAKTRTSESLEVSVDQTSGYAYAAKPSTDKTLTKSDEFADSKIVGDKLKVVDGEINNAKTNIQQNKNDIDTLEIMFKMQRTGKIYGVKKWKSAVNPTSTCDKIYDNKGLVCEMSTDTIEGRDDYAEIPLFKWQRVNYKRYDDGFAYPIAFEGDETFNNVDNADVGNIYMTFYYNEIDKGDYTELVISDTPNHALGLKPWEEAVRADGTVMPYFIMSAYEACRGSDGLLYSLPNKKSAGYASYQNIIDEFQKKGKGYWGAGANRFTFAQIFSQIKYGTKDTQSVAKGNTGYSGHYHANIKRAEKLSVFPLPTTQASYFVVGSLVSVGHQALVNGKPEDSTAYAEIHKYGRDVEVLKVEYSSDGSQGYVHLKCEPFSTEDVIREGVALKVCITAMGHHSGTTDKVIGHHDGSYLSLTDSKMPIRIQGIEYFSGYWFVPSDVVTYHKADFSRDVYFAPRGVPHSKDMGVVKKTYTMIGTIPPTKKGNGADSWIGDITIKNGAWYPSAEIETQNSYCDRLYFGGNIADAWREMVLGGSSGSSSHAGFGCLYLWVELGHSNWNFACAD